MLKEHGLNVVFLWVLWVLALLDFYRRTKETWDVNVKLDEQILMCWTEKM